MLRRTSCLFLDSLRLRLSRTEICSWDQISGFHLLRDSPTRRQERETKVASDTPEKGQDLRSLGESATYFSLHLENRRPCLSVRRRRKSRRIMDLRDIATASLTHSSSSYRRGWSWQVFRVQISYSIEKKDRSVERHLRGLCPLFAIKTNGYEPLLNNCDTNVLYTAKHYNPASVTFSKRSDCPSPTYTKDPQRPPKR